MKRRRSNNSSGYKDELALAAIKGEQTLVELADQFDLHPNQIQQWKRTLWGSKY